MEEPASPDFPQNRPQASVSVAQTDTVSDSEKSGPAAGQIFRSCRSDFSLLSLRSSDVSLLSVRFFAPVAQILRFFAPVGHVFALLSFRTPKFTSRTSKFASGTQNGSGCADLGSKTTNLEQNDVRNPLGYLTDSKTPLTKN